MRACSQAFDLCWLKLTFICWLAAVRLKFRDKAVRLNTAEDRPDKFGHCASGHVIMMAENRLRTDCTLQGEKNDLVVCLKEENCIVF